MFFDCCLDDGSISAFNGVHNRSSILYTHIHTQGRRNIVSSVQYYMATENNNNCAESAKFCIMPSKYVYSACNDILYII